MSLGVSLYAHFMCRVKSTSEKDSAPRYCIGDCVFLQVSINDVTGKQMVESDRRKGNVEGDEHVSETPLEQPSIYVKFLSWEDSWTFLSAREGMGSTRLVHSLGILLCGSVLTVVYGLVSSDHFSLTEWVDACPTLQFVIYWKWFRNRNKWINNKTGAILHVDCIYELKIHVWAIEPAIAP